VRADGGWVMTAPPSRPEARSRLGSQTASELGAPVASSIPEQLGHEPASARKGTKMPMLSYCGIDVSKDRLDVVVLPDEEWFTALNAMVRDDLVWADRHRGRHSVPTAR